MKFILHWFAVCSIIGCIQRVHGYWPPENGLDSLEVIPSAYLDVVSSATTTELSKDCQQNFLNFVSKVNYIQFISQNIDDILNSVSKCWDTKYMRWGQGKCHIDKLKTDILKKSCNQAGGALHAGHYYAGLSGVTLFFEIPTCVPNVCTESDIDAVNKLLMQKTCKKVSSLLVPECKIEIQMNNKIDVPLHVVLYSALTLVICIFAGCILFQTGLCNWLSRDRTKVSNTLDQPLLMRSSSLHETIFSPSMGVMSPWHEGDNQFKIMEGTPVKLAGTSRGSEHLKNWVEASKTSLEDNDSDIDEIVDDEEEDELVDADNSTKSFRLSKKLLKHVHESSTNSAAAKNSTAFTSYHKTFKGEKKHQFRGSSIVWRNLFYRKSKITVLKGVSGYLGPGMCVALIGAPDSGTTTLLKVLAGQTVDGKSSGEILVDGRPPDHTLLRKIGYIPKEDINLPTLTVRETLEFSYDLRAPAHNGKEVRKDRVDAALQLLGLSHVGDTVVGDGQIVRGISGGERRRLSLGVEAVVNRTILLADSPTNGLDSNAAYDVIKTSRALADTGLVAMMASVRQPSPELLYLFDTCCMVSRGSCIYYGPTSKALNYFQSIGYVIPNNKSVPDFLEGLTGDATMYLGTSSTATESQDNTDSVEVAKESIRLKRQPSIARVDLAKSYRESDFYHQLGVAIWKEIDDANEFESRRIQGLDNVEYLGGTDIPDYEEFLAQYTEKTTVEKIRHFFVQFTAWLFTDPRYETSFLKQLFTCVSRQAKITVRSPTSKAKVGSKMFIGILIGTMFKDLDDGQQAAQNRFGLVFLITSAILMGSMSVIPQLFAEREMFYHQKAAGYFRGTVYHLSVLLVELPVIFLQAIAISVIVYPLCGLSGGIMSWNFIYFFVTAVMLELMSWSLCLLGVMLAPSVVVATAVIPTVMAVMTLFAGYLVPRNALPSGMKWLNDLSLLARPFKALAINEVEELVYTCAQSELVPPPNYPNFTAAPPYGFYGEAYRTCALASGKLSLMLYNFDSGEQDKWVLFWQSFYFVIGFNIVLVFVIAFVNFRPDSSDAAVTTAKSRRKQMIAMGRELKKAIRSQSGDSFREILNLDLDSLENGGEPSLKNSTNGSIEFTNLNYSVFLPSGLCQKETEKQLLFDVSGYVKTGTVVALMGASGAGKSTLLDVLANKKTGGKVTFDTLLINGKPRDKYFARHAGYVEQMDSHLPTTTVREAIEASAALRLPRETSLSERKKRVQSVIDSLLLGPFQDKVIGTPGAAGKLAGVTPEVRKKVTIAVELVFDPPLLFLDEPTTGLDAYSALRVMSILKQVCKQKAVICTIHQPAAEVFALFDWILLLRTGGRVVYFGPVDSMDDYFDEQGMGRCPKGKNPADFALECSKVGGAGLADPAEKYDNSEWKENILAQAPQFDTNVVEDTVYESQFAASSWEQFKFVLKAQFNYMARDTALLKTRCAMSIVFGLLIGALFFKLKNDQAGAKARIGLMFISMVYMGYTAIMSIPKMIDLRAVFFREYTSNMYRLPTYYAAATVAELPFTMLQMLLYVVVFYPMTGLQADFHHVLYFLFGLTVSSVTCYAFSSFIAALSPNADTGTIVNTLLNSVFTLFCGFILPYKSIPPFWKFAYYISIYRYPLGFLMTNEMKGLDFGCGASGKDGAFPIFVGGMTNATPPFPYGLSPIKANCLDIENSLDNPECFQYYCPIIKGDTILEQFSFPETDSKMFENLFILLCIYIVIRLLGLAALHFVQHIRR